MWSKKHKTKLPFVCVNSTPVSNFTVVDSGYKLKKWQNLNTKTLVLKGILSCYSMCVFFYA